MKVKINKLRELYELQKLQDRVLQRHGMRLLLCVDPRHANPHPVQLLQPRIGHNR